MTVFVADISDYQRGLTIRELRDAGMVAVVIKATEGESHQQRYFAGWVADARRLGMPVAAYHFLHDGDNNYLVRQAANTARVVPDDVPVFVDAEGGVGIAPAQRYAEHLTRQGLHVPVIYNAHDPGPHYGWWRARYLTNPTGSAQAIYTRQGGDTGRGWVAGVDMWQFTSRGRIPGYSGDVDISAYRGTAAELAATGWFFPREATRKDDDMPAICVKPTGDPQPGDAYLMVGAGGITVIPTYETYELLLTAEQCHPVRAIARSQWMALRDRVPLTKADADAIVHAVLTGVGSWESGDINVESVVAAIADGLTARLAE